MHINGVGIGGNPVARIFCPEGFLILSVEIVTYDLSSITTGAKVEDIIVDMEVGYFDIFSRSSSDIGNFGDIFPFLVENENHILLFVE